MIYENLSPFRGIPRSTRQLQTEEILGMRGSLQEVQDATQADPPAIHEDQLQDLERAETS